MSETGFSTNDQADNAINQDELARTKTVLPFEFRGDGMEYFKIWIVNIALTVLTLGIYSAWAKVRNNRYFYSNLYLDGHNFSYLASPMQILRGRIIAVIALVGYSIVSQMWPVAAGILLLLLLIALPYIFNSALAFNQRNSAYKNIQFRFHGTYWGAFMVIFVWPVLGIFSAGILYPKALKELSLYVTNNSAYGTTKFEFHATAWDYGKIMLALIGIIMAFAVVAVLMQMLVASIAPEIAPAMVGILSLGYFGAFIYMQVAMVNLYYQSSSILGHRFDANLNYVEFAKVILIIGLLTVITLGLYLPAAKVRMTKYYASRISVEVDGELEDFIAAEKEQLSALGEQVGEVFDLDLGL